MELAIFHCEARSAFHFGNRGVGIEETDDHAPSDTIFSALCNTLRMIEGVSALDALLASCRDRNPPFICSGGFPFVRAGEQIIRFYPAPRTRRYAPIDKKVREATWFSESLFLLWLNGGQWHDFEDVVEIEGHSAIVSFEEANQIKSQPTLYDAVEDRYHLWDRGEVTRVAVDRVSGAANVFQVGRLRFGLGGGLWCGFAGAEESGFGTARLHNLLAHLGEIGLGGERSAGHGQFTVTAPTSMAVPEPMSGHPLITLSNFHPRSDERDMLGGRAAYDLVRRQGWLSSPDGGGQRHKTVRMITAGSVLALGTHVTPFGDIVDVTPDGFVAHRVYRSGFGLALGTYGE